MSKAVKGDHDFQIDRYSELLVKAQGGRTQTQFAKDCGLSTAYICKHINKKLKTAPIPSTIKKIAAVAANGVTYEELMDAAGYDITKYSSERLNILTNNNSSFKKIATAIITSALSNSNLKWSILGSSDHKDYSDLHVEVTGNKTTHWLFSYVTSYQNMIPDEKKDLIKRLLTYYGYLALLPYENTTTYSFVTDSEAIYEILKTYSPLSLALYISIYLIDKETLTIKKAEYLQSACSDRPSDTDLLINQ